VTISCRPKKKVSVRSGDSSAKRSRRKNCSTNKARTVRVGKSGQLRVRQGDDWRTVRLAGQIVLNGGGRVGIIGYDDAAEGIEASITLEDVIMQFLGAGWELGERSVN
jgi:hypothetical protein